MWPAPTRGRPPWRTAAARQSRRPPHRSRRCCGPRAAGARLSRTVAAILPRRSRPLWSTRTTRLMSITPRCQITTRRRHRMALWSRIIFRTTPRTTPKRITTTLSSPHPWWRRRGRRGGSRRRSSGGPRKRSASRRRTRGCSKRSRRKSLRCGGAWAQPRALWSIWFARCRGRSCAIQWSTSRGAPSSVTGSSACLRHASLSRTLLSRVSLSSWRMLVPRRTC
mmetsp:Transcript_44730/g.135684  ORF Transcript_44730/g.135684 Transcript_44730/m.135684 type:complete len:223 (+) Transcript_44730:75-743(+)